VPQLAVNGDVLKLQIRVEDGIITDAKFKAYGCGAMIASSSLVSEMIKGLTIEEAREIKNSVIAEELALPP
jgi:nitrogen fixation NifU-like protein